MMHELAPRERYYYMCRECDDGLVKRKLSEYHAHKSFVEILAEDIRPLRIARYSVYGGESDANLIFEDFLDLGVKTVRRRSDEGPPSGPDIKRQIDGHHSLWLEIND